MPFVYRKRTMEAAWESVGRKKGAPGVDGESIDDFGTHAKERLWELSEALRTKSWHPKPLRRVWIPKPGAACNHPSPVMEGMTGGKV
jgi:RNA-directed DNA polymerase